MLSIVLATVWLQQGPISIPSFSSWDGKSWAGMTVGVSEKDLKKQVKNSKTVGPDPASLRITVDRKGWVVAAILTEPNNKGSLTGFTIELERNEPIESLEVLAEELGPPSFSAFSRLRFGDWSLAVWKEKGIAAVVGSGDRPLVQKVLLAEPAVLARNLDLWDRDPNEIRRLPLIPVSDIDVNVSVEPRDSSLEDVCRRALNRSADRLLRSYRGPGWEEARNGERIKVSMQVRKKSSITIDGSVSLSHRDDLGDVTVSETGSESAKRDSEVTYKAETLFDNLMTKLGKEIDGKIQRLIWQAEWRPYTALTRPSPR